MVWLSTVCLSITNVKYSDVAIANMLFYLLPFQTLQYTELLYSSWGSQLREVAQSSQHGRR